jgi:hypothetical protein
MYTPLVLRSSAATVAEAASSRWIHDHTPGAVADDREAALADERLGGAGAVVSNVARS